MLVIQVVDNAGCACKISGEFALGLISALRATIRGSANSDSAKGTAGSCGASGFSSAAGSASTVRVAASAMRCRNCCWNSAVSGAAADVIFVIGSDLKGADSSVPGDMTREEIRGWINGRATLPAYSISPVRTPTRLGGIQKPSTGHDA